MIAAKRVWVIGVVTLVSLAVLFGVTACGGKKAEPRSPSAEPVAQESKPEAKQAPSGAPQGGSLTGGERFRQRRMQRLQNQKNQ
jgi:negative regulator of sigma E activity